MCAPRGHRLRPHHHALVLLLGGITRRWAKSSPPLSRSSPGVPRRSLLPRTSRTTRPSRSSAPSRSCVASTSSCPQASSTSTTACCSSGRLTSAPLSAAASSSARQRLPRDGRASGGSGEGETEGERRPLTPGVSGGWRPRVGWNSLLWDALKRENTELWGAPVCSTSFAGCFGDVAG
jgi:hypothetical protein